MDLVTVRNLRQRVHGASECHCQLHACVMVCDLLFVQF